MAFNKIVDTFKNDSFMFSISVIALALVIFHKSTSNDQEILSSHSRPEERRVVDANEVTNEALTDVHLKGRAQKDKVEAENSLPYEDLNEADLQPLDQIKSGLGPRGIVLEQRDKAEEVAHEVILDNQMIDYASKLDAQVRRQLSNEDFLNKHGKDYEKEYIRQFLANARRDGYKVILNEDLTVRSVKKIQKKPLSKTYY